VRLALALLLSMSALLVLPSSCRNIASRVFCRFAYNTHDRGMAPIFGRE
jgi:hypothetical protein